MGNVMSCSKCGDRVPVAEGVVVPDGWWGGLDGRGPIACGDCLAVEEWVGVDWDGTICEYHGWLGPGLFGKPITLMVNRIREWLARGTVVKVVTARAVAPDDVVAIEEKCVELFGRKLPVTDRKDFRMRELWDDRAVRVEKNTGRIA